jgi:hypothetical protein
MTCRPGQAETRPAWARMKGKGKKGNENLFSFFKPNFHMHFQMKFEFFANI